MRTVDLQTQRNSRIPDILAPDELKPVPGLTSTVIKSLCSSNVFKKAKRFEVKKSIILTTQVYPLENQITGSYKAVKIYDQNISWGNNTERNVPFSIENRTLFCQCRFFTNGISTALTCCKHIIGHLRRIIYITT